MLQRTNGPDVIVLTLLKSPSGSRLYYIVLWAITQLIANFNNPLGTGEVIVTLRGIGGM
jgi:hypothetical protein